MRHGDQVSSVLRRAVQAVLTRGLNDPRVKGLITVTDVQVSPDGAQATVKVSIEPEEGSDLAMHGLRHAAPHVRWQVSKATDMRRVPRLEFKLDRSLKTQARILAAINRGRKRDEQLRADAGGQPGPEPDDA